MRFLLVNVHLLEGYDVSGSFIIMISNFQPLKAALEVVCLKTSLTEHAQYTCIRERERSAAFIPPASAYEDGLVGALCRRVQ